jgi:hypothetical protein
MYSCALTFVSLCTLQMIKDFLAAHNTQDVGIVPNEGAAAASDVSDGEEEANETKKKVFLDIKKGKKDADGDVVMPDAGVRAGGVEGDVADAQPKYLTPTEAREMMKRIWNENADVLKYIFPGSPSSDEGLVSTSGVAGDGGNHVSSWRDFFLQTIPVAPNRYVVSSNVCSDRRRGSEQGLLTLALPPDMTGSDRPTTWAIWCTSTHRTPFWSRY